MLGYGLLFLQVSLSAAAQPADNEPLEISSTLRFADIYNSALESAPETLERDVRLRQAESYEAIADNWITNRPSVQLSYFNDRLFDDIGMREYEYAVQLELKRPSERNNGRLLSQAYQQQVDAWELSLHHYIAGRVRSVLAAIAEADANLRLETEATANAENLLAITSSLVDAGELARLDLMQAENLLLTQRRRELEAEAMLVDAERAYEVLTGLQVRPDYVYTETLTDREDIDESHPRLQYLQTEITLADATIVQRQAEARGSPTVSLGSRRSRGDGFQPFNDSIALSLSIPFGAKNLVESRTSSARRDKVDVEVLYQNTLRSLNQSLHEVEHELFLTNEEIVIADQQRVLSEQRWQMAQTAFTQGEITLTQVIQALQETLDARKQNELLLLQRERLIIEFNQTIGVMP